MSDYIDTREGWRIVTEEPKTMPFLAEYDEGQGVEWVRYWVRDVPVPALPTTPYTVIRVEWKNNEISPRVLTLVEGEWNGQNRSVRVFATGEHLATEITGFEVLSEPRAVTAKAVLDRVFEWTELERGEDEKLDGIYREFGVES